jgi:protease IV
MLKNLLGWWLRSLVTFVVILAVMFVATVITDYVSHRVPSGSVLTVTLQGPVVERGRTGFTGLLQPKQTSLNLIRLALRRATRDPRIVGVAFKIIDPELEFAQAQEIIALEREVARHGKWTAAYLESAGESGPGSLPYIVAAASQQVSLMPQGELNLLGVGIREIFTRAALDSIGVRPNFDAIGEYKSAANIFTQKDFTPAEREENEALVSDLYGQLVSAIAVERKLSADTVRGLIDQAPLTADAGLGAHLVDRLEYADQFTDRMKDYGGKKHTLVNYTSYVRPWVLPSLRSYPRIAVIYGDGEIARSSGFGSPFGGGATMAADKMAQAFKQARDDDSIKAIVFRINSPGGSAVASELIRRQAELAAKKKPLIVSMSGYAASGGYWVATPARLMFAEPGTVTGSIGVLAGKFNFAPAAQKWGINSDAIVRGANFEMFSGFTDFTPQQQKILRDRMLGTTYRRFLELVANSRHMTEEAVDKIARGRVWTGEQAYQLKLVDRLGGFDEALDEAKADAGIKPEAKVQLVELPAQPSIIEQLLGDVDAREQVTPALAVPRPWKWLVRLVLAGRQSFDAAYCPLVPVM